MNGTTRYVRPAMAGRLHVAEPGQGTIVSGAGGREPSELCGLPGRSHEATALLVSAFVRYTASRSS